MLQVRRPNPKWLSLIMLAALASSNAAHADIIYVDMPDAVLQGGGGGAPIDFNSNGAIDLSWSVLIGDDPTCGCSSTLVFCNGHGGAQTAAVDYMTIALDVGDLIDASLSFDNFSELMIEQWSSCCTKPAYCDGDWCQTGQTQFIGARFLINSVEHYGWVRTMRFGDHEWDWGIVLFDFAYESQPQTPIIAGKMCSADTDLSGEVSVADLLAVINGWGACNAPCPPCAGDVNYDCSVNVADLLAVIAAWGPCS
jgi:hypothetical protein